ncbi:MAG TPA: DUF2171 domain-containing protein [bacterium]|nr:DUF2171 domain-containing protein [bacterium]
MADSRNQPRRGGDADDSVSWRMIATGMPVVASDGATVGRVTHALGDPDRDIFDGVGFRHHLWSSPRMAPAALVARITESAVHLSVPAAQAEQCPAYEEEHVFKIGNTGFFRHREGWRAS